MKNRSFIFGATLLTIALTCFGDSYEAGKRVGGGIKKGAEESSKFGSGVKDGAGCFIATAVYGSDDTPQVKTLRKFRDKCLLTNATGKRFVGFYYEHGPKAAEYVKNHCYLQKPIKMILDGFVGLLNVTSLKDTK